MPTPFKIKEIQKELESYYEQAGELEVLQHDVFNVKADMSIGAVVLLLKKLDGGINDVVEILNDKESYGKELCDSLKSIVAQLISFSTNPQINVTPKISVDISKPLQGVMEKLEKQNATIVNLITKISNGNNNEALQNLAVTLMESQKVFLEKTLQQMDVRPELKSIDETLKDRPTKWKILNVTRSNGLLVSAEIEVVKNNSNV